MKKLIRIATLTLILAFVSFNAKAQSTNDNALIGKARAAAHDCLRNFAGSDITASVSTTGTCSNGGSSYQVTFTAGPHCAGNGPCPYFVVLAATVTFDCDGNVIAVNCSQ